MRFSDGNNLDYCLIFKIWDGGGKNKPKNFGVSVPLYRPSVSLCLICSAPIILDMDEILSTLVPKKVLL